MITKPKNEKGLAFAPTNIALVKYWGKRNIELNLPMNSSLSVALPDKGSMTALTLRDARDDRICLNGVALEQDSNFVRRVVEFLDLFRPLKNWHLQIDITMNLPVAAGLASSACGFASLVIALNDLFSWRLSQYHLSILARLGSGSACRSLWKGFVEWHKGTLPNGMDSYAEPLSFQWPELNIGILSISEQPKPISSREAMQRTVDTSVLYESWPKKVLQDSIIVKQAIHKKNFSLLGGAAESNALAMHATMLSSWPPMQYSLPETIAAIQKIWTLRKQGFEVYFTQDAGPNLKLLFLQKDKLKIQNNFPNVEVMALFESS